MNKPIATITSTTLIRFILLGLPGVILWTIGGLGALALFGGLMSGTVVPGTDSSALSLGVMWGSVVLSALGGILLGVGSLFLRFRKSVLAANVIAGFFSLFFSILAAS